MPAPFARLATVLISPELSLYCRRAQFRLPTNPKPLT
jgi:hypothetical protein